MFQTASTYCFPIVRQIVIWTFIAIIWATSIFIPCRVEAIQNISVEKMSNIDLCFFMCVDNRSVNNFAGHLIPSSNVFEKQFNFIVERFSKINNTSVKFRKLDRVNISISGESISNQFSDNKADDSSDGKCDGGLYCNWHIRYFLLGFSGGAWAMIIFFAIRGYLTRG
jgi:hypothetical protein